ncbi:MAG: pirin family protein [Rhodocyclaceae bacterium]|nr:MAG: pirin family protein [Rhodocyclaceae bacterium]
MSTRTLKGLIPALQASDGAGVKLLRSLGQTQGHRLDPFLMLDSFSSDNPDDYIAGFPPHPHRGFETVTYMLDGHMLHEDHLGNRGDLRGGGAQWMTAGRGIIHSEMPQQTNGRLRGFQLWINLPAKEKMKPASYRDIQPEEIPTATLADGIEVRVVAGVLDTAGTTVAGPIRGISTQPLFLDVRLPAGTVFTHGLPEGHHAFVYPYEGMVDILAPGQDAQRINTHQAGLLGTGDGVTISATDQAARFLLLAAHPLNEPVVQYGPFVMNTREEIEQAVFDYQNKQLT